MLGTCYCWWQKDRGGMVFLMIWLTYFSLFLYKLCYGLKPGEIKLPVSILGLVAFVALGFEEWILLPGLGSAAISDNL